MSRFRSTDIEEFIDDAGEGLRADRERALLCMAYETLARRGRVPYLSRETCRWLQLGLEHAEIFPGRL